MRIHRLLMLGLAAGTLGASGTYLFVYLYRWEWNRALICGIVFLAAELGVIAWSIHARLTDLDHRMDAQTDRQRRIGHHLATARGAPSHPFAWLDRETTRLGVFIPILLGAGLIMSALAWALDHLGRATAGRLDDRRVADRLSRLGPPPHGFLHEPDDPLRLLRGPGSPGRPVR